MVSLETRTSSAPLLVNDSEEHPCSPAHRSTQRKRRVLLSALLTTLALLCSAVPVEAQDNRCTIRGKVRDADTGEPVEFANVFLASTTYGTAADAHGVFIIRNVPQGTHQLVASRVGYSSAAVSIQCTGASVISHNFALRSRVLSTEGMDVEAATQEQWKKDFAEFREEFLGTDDFAQQCTIMNPGVIALTRDGEKNILHGSSMKPLEIVNMALGYRVSVDLQSFTSRRDEGIVHYEVFNRFEETLPRDSVQKALWQANREKAFRGSRMHFLRSAAQGTLEKENFRVYRGELPALRILRGTYVGPNLEGIMSTVSPGLKQLSWDGYLRVEYQGADGWSNSICQLTRGPLFLEQSGYIDDPTAFVVLTDSPWGKDRLGRTLPLNYGQ
jgi:hypothetical protein